MEENKREEIREETIESEEHVEEKVDEGGKRKSDVGIFIFLGVMALLMLAAVGFVIYVCSGQASGCNCGQCS